MELRTARGACASLLVYGSLICMLTSELQRDPHIVIVFS